MYRQFVTTKIHAATVTGADLAYAGSITIGRDIVEAAGLLPFELVHINNYRNGVHWETFVIKGEPGEIVLNGPPANLFQPGDRVVINRVEFVAPDEVQDVEQRVVFLDERNRVARVERYGI